MRIDRKTFLQNLSIAAGAALLPDLTQASPYIWKKPKMQLGFVTYLWGKDWDVPTLIKNLSDTHITGVELRVEHAHKVMPDLTAGQRKEVKKQFADSPVKIVGLGTNQQYDYPDQEKLKASIEKTKDFIRLSADVGGTGVKVKPNALHKEVPTEKTLEQIGLSLHALAAYAADFGQQLRLEVHGEETQELPNIRKIMDYADHKNAKICWNCNKQDLNGEGFQYNFDLVKKYFGDTCHVRELDRTDYPYPELIDNLAKMDYKGWVLLECHTNPDDKISALQQQRKVFDQMMAKY
ncbi:sugar phosphate isomerase/epimerase family protein [Dyadobacter fermentans]|uniref:Xylose isomerase domain protein TIM barrel n=1 Tax=Dyadobacter fermentans (strain ATCC 700827 / DSM 18053 / CIP 107007 / KCTC 52180 / NS114) TaxID=471854 RepID=C6W744_DYAFD|nr:TIM barrel protein [Dyadobacter fermentans]ACT92653.1 Xylose isomerase domain protein TIM barrel [Dyadobacter fermentans DSM 18053]